MLDIVLLPVSLMWGDEIELNDYEILIESVFLWLVLMFPFLYFVFEFYFFEFDFSLFVDELSHFSKQIYIILFFIIMNIWIFDMAVNFNDLVVLFDVLGFCNFLCLFIFIFDELNRSNEFNSLFNTFFWYFPLKFRDVDNFIVYDLNICAQTIILLFMSLLMLYLYLEYDVYNNCCVVLIFCIIEFFLCYYNIYKYNIGEEYILSKYRERVLRVNPMAFSFIWIIISVIVATPCIIEIINDGEIIQYDMDGEIIQYDMDGEIIQYDMDGEIIQYDINEEIS